jgi:phosphoglycolate phosphatase-like HAD superfamily hydrolase
MNIIFDLDGTLIDSKHSVLKTYQSAYEIEGIEPDIKIDRNLIGPTLRAGIHMLSPNVSEDAKDKLARRFIKIYDEENFKLIKPYEGIDKLLKEIKLAHHFLYLATNKRAAVVALILEYLNWSPYFDAVYSIDSRVPPYASKAAILNDICKGRSNRLTSGIYIGDTIEDAIAAGQNQLKFILAAWDVAELEPKNWVNLIADVAETPADIERLTGFREKAST